MRLSATLLFLLFSFIGGICFGQQFDYLWAKSFGSTYGANDEGSSIQTDAAGNTFVVGNFSGTLDLDPGSGVTQLVSEGPQNSFIAKYNASGALIWAKQIRGGSNVTSYSSALDNVGNLIVAGTFTQATDFDLSPASYILTTPAQDLFVAKYDSAGTLIWAKNLVGNSTSVLYDVTTDPSGNIYTTGYINGTVDFDPGIGIANQTNVGPENGFIAKYNTSGTYIWAKTFASSLGLGTHGKSIIADNSANVYVTGFLSGISDFNPGVGTNNLTSTGSSDIFLGKYDAFGNYVWAFRLGSTGASEGMALAFDATYNPLLTAYFEGTVDFDPSVGVANLTALATTTDMVIAKYTTAGLYTFAQQIAGSAAAWTQPRDMSVDGAGNIYVCGSFRGTVDFAPGASTISRSSTGGESGFLAKYGTTGLAVWANAFTGADTVRCVSVHATGAGVPRITGEYANTVDLDPGAGTNLKTAGARNSMLAGQYTTAGLHQWGISSTETVSSGMEEGYYTSTDAAGNVYVTGYFEGTVDFDPGIGVTNLTSIAGRDFFVSKFNSAGVLTWAKSIGGSGNDYSQALKVDANGNVFITGWFGGTVDFDPNAGTFNMTPTGGSDMFLLKLTSAGAFSFAIRVGGTANDYGFDLALDANGRVYVAGRYNGTVDFDPSAATANQVAVGNAMYVAKYTNTGAYTTAWTIDGPGNSDDIRRIVLDPSGNVWVGGTFLGTTIDLDPSAGNFILTNQGDNDIFLAKYNTVGTLLTGFAIQGTSSETIGGFAFTPSGHMYVSGVIAGTTDFDPSAGILNVTSPNSYGNGFVARYLPSGAPSWVRQIYGDRGVSPNFCAVDMEGGCIYGGIFRGQVDLDPGAGTQSVTVDVNSTHGFLSNLDSVGTLVAASAIGSLGFDNFSSAAVSSDFGVYVTGYITGTTDFDLSPAIANVSVQGRSDAILAKYVLPCSTLTLNVTAQTNVICNGGNNGSASVVASGSGGYSYLWSPSGGTSTTASGLTAGTYRCIVTDRCGKKDTAQVTITQPAAIINNMTASTCQSFTLNNQTYTSSGIYLQTLTTALGCDSVIRLTLTIRQPSTSTLTRTACGSFTLNNTTYTASGTYVQHLTNSVGCDSAVTLNLTIKQPTTATISQNVCGSYTLNSQTYTTSGTYTQIRTNAAGCDSTITLNLIVRQPTSSTITQNVCGSYTLNNQTYTSSGTYTQVRPNAAGCDSTITLNLTVRNTSATTLTQSACSSYVLNNTTYTNSGTFTQVLTNSVGCDSTITLNLTIAQPTARTLTVDTCDSYTLNNQTYTSSGTYTQLLTNAAGCDSTLTLNLTLRQASTHTITQSACVSYTLNNQTYTSSGIYTQHFTNAVGCDSSLVLDLTILQPTSETVVIDACDSYSANGQTYTTSGTHTQSLTNVAGCDSTLTIQLTVTTIGATATLNGLTLTASPLNATYYTWYDCITGDIAPVGNTPYFTPTQSGNYAVIITMGLCTDTSNCIIVVGTPACNFCHAVKVYPNPTRSYFNVDFGQPMADTKLRLSNAAGQIVWTTTLNGNFQVVPMEQLSAGMYFLEITNQEGYGRFKIVKQ